MNDDTLRLLDYEGMKGLFRPHLASDLGRNALERLRPYRDARTLFRVLEEASEAIGLLDRGIRLPLGGCHDLDLLLRSVHDRGRPFEPEELACVRETLHCARNLVMVLEGIRRDHPEIECPRFTSLAGEIPAFTVLTDRIDEVIEERGRVRDEASARLATIRSEIRSVRDRIEKKVAELLARKDMKACFQEFTLRYRSGRVVLAVKADRRGEVRGVVHDVSQSGATCFVEPEGVVTEGNLLEDLLGRERREVTRILWEITVKVLEFDGEIRAALAALERVEVATAAAAAARAHGLSLPALIERRSLRFRKARHPVLVLMEIPTGVVPIDLRLGDDFHLLVVTGPNTGGKTVALKTLGILTLMCQSGLPVPAAEAEFFLTSEVFVDIGDEQSLAQSLSTFSSHMSRIARFLAAAGEDTLLLLDELGSGTDPVEGAALGRAILDFLHRRRVPTMVTTHLGALKTYAFTHSGASNASVEFDVETLSPTYRLLIGQPGSSNALTIAERLGVPSEVVAGARALVRPEDRAGEEILEKAQQIRSEAERRLRQADAFRSDVQDLKVKAEEEFREAEQKRLQVETEAEEEMDRALSRVKKLVVEFAREMGNAPKPFGPKAKEFLAKAEEEIRATPLVRRREDFAAGLHRGDEVFVPRLGERFTVHQVRKKERILTVMKGSLKVDIPFADVTWI